MPTSSQQASQPAHEPESATSTSELVGKGAFRLVGEGEQNQETLSQGRLAAGGEQGSKSEKNFAKSQAQQQEANSIGAVLEAHRSRSRRIKRRA